MYLHMYVYIYISNVPSAPKNITPRYPKGIPVLSVHDDPVEIQPEVIHSNGENPPEFRDPWGWAIFKQSHMEHSIRMHDWHDTI